uniref:Ig-like domain-containing protein n=1 Tax=Amphiprion percula TaxID=161767 RepID=A0A3P8TIA6_AMPPE
MTPPMISFCVTCLLWGAMIHLTTPKRPSTLRFVPVNVGEEVTLECFHQKDSLAMMFFWYKQTLGHKPELVSTYYKYERNGIFNDDLKTNPRFQLETSRGKNHLKISNVQMSDSATYYCISCYLYKCEYLEDIIIQVESSGLNLQALVEQSASETIQPGDAVTLSCTVHTGTCDEEHSVYWFKDEEESHPGLIYTHGGRNDRCERKPNTQTQTCVYNLPLKSLNLTDVGTYYCAVASCGRILFGNGTKLDFEEEAGSLVLVYVLSGALGFNTILAVLLAYKAYAMDKTKSCKCAETSSAASAPNAEVNEDSLHYAALRQNKVNRSRRIKDDNMIECVYSSVRQ